MNPERELSGLLPDELRALAREILKIDGAPLWHVVGDVRRVNSVEFTRRVMVLRERLAAHEESTARPLPTSGKGWSKGRVATPGRMSGHYRDRD